MVVVYSSLMYYSIILRNFLFNYYSIGKRIHFIFSVFNLVPFIFAGSQFLFIKSWLAVARSWIGRKIDTWKNCLHEFTKFSKCSTLIILQKPIRTDCFMLVWMTKVPWKSRAVRDIKAFWIDLAKLKYRYYRPYPAIPYVCDGTGTKSVLSIYNLYKYSGFISLI